MISSRCIKYWLLSSFFLEHQATSLQKNRFYLSNFLWNRLFCSLLLLFCWRRVWDYLLLLRRQILDLLVFLRKWRFHTGCSWPFFFIWFLCLKQGFLLLFLLLCILLPLSLSLLQKLIESIRIIDRLLQLIPKPVNFPFRDTAIEDSFKEDLILFGMNFILLHNRKASKQLLTWFVLTTLIINNSQWPNFILFIVAKGRWFFLERIAGLDVAETNGGVEWFFEELSWRWGTLARKSGGV